jgi:SAM-dependent methyltransferase
MPAYTGPHDYFDEEYVREWERNANAKRPYRSEFFDAFVKKLSALNNAKVLDLGSGPGFLAEYILERCDVASYHLLDFSPFMIEMSRARLAPFAGRAVFHQGSFTDEGWWQSLPAPFDAIVSLQAVHEVRDTNRIPQLYRELRSLLVGGGLLLIADKVNAPDDHEEHHATPEEHKAALKFAGLIDIRQAHAAGDLVLFAAKQL